MREKNQGNNCIPTNFFNKKPADAALSLQSMFGEVSLYCQLFWSKIVGSITELEFRGEFY